MAEAPADVALSGGVRFWIRRCASCARDDLNGAFGRPTMIPPQWACPACGTTRYLPVQLPFPPTGGTGRCPRGMTA